MIDATYLVAHRTAVSRLKGAVPHSRVDKPPACFLILELSGVPKAG